MTDFSRVPSHRMRLGWFLLLLIQEWAGGVFFLLAGLAGTGLFLFFGVDSCSSSLRFLKDYTFLFLL